MKRFLTSLLLIFPILTSSASGGFFDKLNEIKQKAQEVKEGVEKVKEVGEVLKGAPSRPSGVVVVNDDSKPWFFKVEWFDAGGLSQIYYQVNDGNPVLLGEFKGSLGKLNLPPVKIPGLKKGDRVRFLVKTFWNGKWYGPVYSDDPRFFVVKREGNAYSFQFEDAASADSAYNDGKFSFYQGEEPVFRNGLVAHWSFDDCTAKDGSGNGYSGTIHGHPVCVNGVRGKSLALNLKAEGENGCGQKGGDFISIPALGGIWDRGITVCAWAKFTEPRFFERIVDLGGGSGEEGGYPVFLGRLETTDQIVLESWVNEDGSLNRSRGRLANPAITEGKFRFYCGVIENLGGDRGLMELFVDGKPIAKKEGNGVKNAVRARNFIGHSNWCFNDPDFKGVIDEVYLFNRPLTEGEIRELYSKTAPPASPSSKPALFGSSKKSPFVFEGSVYFIPEGTDRLPDFSKLKPVGKIYTPVLNVTPRSFREGFPGVTDRFEWFAIDYKGKIYLPQDRKFTFYLLSDDGARLVIDGKTVIDNDGIHPPVEKSGSVSLKKGFHTVEVQYFQGPRYEVALVLSYLKEGQKVPFDVRDFAPVRFEEKDCQVNLTVSSAVLFDFNSYALKPEAKKVLDEVASYVVNTPYQKVVVEGHTDDVGSEDYNLKLSRQRARSVADYLIAKGVDPEKVEVVGYGESKPKYPNTTEENRAKNRRVEIKLLKRCER